MKQLKRLILTGIIGAYCCALYCQDNKYKCYHDLRAEGVRLMQQKNYGEASSRFWAALITCPEKPANNDLSDLIQQCQASWVRDLEKSVQQQKEAYQTALAAQREAEAAKVSEEKARKEAEANAALARERGIKAESLRLALLSDMIRQKGRTSDALVLAYLALQMAGPDTSGVMMRAFGEAVRDSMTNTLFSSPNAAEYLQQVAGGQILLLKTAGGPFYIIKQANTPGATARVVQLEAGFTHVVAAPAGDLFVAWGSGNTARLIDAGGAAVATLSGHTEAIRCAAFSPDGKQIATGSRDNSARIWDRGGKLLATIGAHQGNVLEVVFSPDGAALFTRSADGSVSAWDTQGAPIAGFNAEDKLLRRATLSPDGKWLAAVFSDGSATFWHAGGARLRDLNNGRDKIQGAFQFAQNAPFAAVRQGIQEIGIWSDEGNLLQTLRHPAQVSGFCIGPDGAHLLTWAKDRVARLWDAGGTLLHEFRGHQQEIISAEMSADHKFILTSSKDGTAKLWDNNGNILSEWITGAGAPAQFSADNPGVLLALDNGRTLAFSPFPADVYGQMDRGAILSSEPAGRLLHEFNVQFSNELR